MSTKNLARTVIEGGRANTYTRKASHRTERAYARAWLDRLRFDIDLADATSSRKRPSVGKEFADKLRPCWRWLTSRVGQPWDDVYCELMTRFDTRKLSNKHVVFDHMRNAIADAGGDRMGAAWQDMTRFYVDEAGTLRARDRAAAAAATYAAAQAQMRATPAYAAAAAYAAGRRVRYGFSGRCWYVPGRAIWTPCLQRNASQCPHAEHRRVETTPAHLVERYASPGFTALGAGEWWRTYRIEHSAPGRVYTPFSRADEAWWETLSGSLKDAFTV